MKTRCLLMCRKLYPRRNILLIWSLRTSQTYQILLRNYSPLHFLYIITMAKKTITKIKTTLITEEEMLSLKKKFWSLRTTVSTYETQYWSQCTLYIYWMNWEKAWQLQDYWYWKVFKDFLSNKCYTTYKQWADK